MCTESIGAVRLVGDAIEQDRAAARIAAKCRSPSAGSPVHRYRTDRVSLPASIGGTPGISGSWNRPNDVVAASGRLTIQDRHAWITAAACSPSNHSDPP